MRHTTIENSLRNALAKNYPQGIIESSLEGQVGIADVVLKLNDERIAFEVKTNNFYDGLGRTVLLAKKYNKAYLVVPHQILPPQSTLNLIPKEIGIIGFQIQDSAIRFQTIIPIGNELPNSLGSTIEEKPVKFTNPARVSLVSAKALRVVRYLVSHRSTTQIEVSRDTRVSLGMVNKVVSSLVDRDLVSYRGKKLVVFDVWKLLNEISWNRSLRSLKKIDARLPQVESVREAESEFAKICERESMKYALTLFSGASKYVGYGMSYDSIQAYVDQPEQLNKFDRKQTNGIALEVYGIDTPDVIDEARSIDGLVVCSPTQVVLDLVSYGRTGRDWAVKLYEAAIVTGEKTDVNR